MLLHCRSSMRFGGVPDTGHDDNIAGPSPCRMDLSSCMLAPVAGRRMISFWVRCHIQIKLKLCCQVIF